MQETAVSAHYHCSRSIINVPPHSVLEEAWCVSLHSGHLQQLFTGFHELDQTRLKLLDQVGCSFCYRFAALALVISPEHVLTELEVTILNQLGRHVLVDHYVIRKHSIFSWAGDCI